MAGGHRAMITLITVMVWRTIERLMKPRYNFHSLRHFAASWFIEQGFSAQRVQEIMGHKSIQTTFDIYGHLFPNDCRSGAVCARPQQAIGSVSAAMVRAPYTNRCPARLKLATKTTSFATWH